VSILRAELKPNAFLSSQTLGFLALQQTENAIPTVDILTISWSSLMSTFEWAGRSDQFAKIKTFLPVLAPFVKKPMDQVNLLQIVQTYCYDEQKVMKSFPNIVRVLWDAELVSVRSHPIFQERFFVSRRYRS
jgi:hypothetical protein